MKADVNLTDGSPGDSGAVQPTRARLVRISGLLDEFFVEATAAHEACATGAARGPKISFSTRLSRELGGHLSVGLHAIHAAPGAGKTALANQIAAEAGCPALVLSCEMGPLELLRRHIARETNTYLGKLRTGQFPPSESLTLARRTAAAMPKLAIADATRGPLSPIELREFARATRGSDDHLLIVVDSLHAWVRSVFPDATEYDQLGLGINVLQQLAATEKCAILVVCERNRVGMGDDGLHSTKGTAGLEYACESVWALGRKKDAVVDADGKMSVDLTLAKNRNGAPGVTIPLEFAGGFMKFTDPSEQRKLRPA